MALRNDTLLVAVCGVDGVGKSSIARQLSQSSPIPDVVSMHKTTSRAASLATQYTKREFGDWRDWNSGPFAQTVALATAIDFLDYYHNDILPQLSKSQLVITDRYAPCYAGYLESINAAIPHQAIFGNIRKADLTIIVEAPQSLIRKRLSERGGELEDENEALSVALSAAYKSVAPTYSKSILYIENVGDLTDAIKIAEGAIISALDETRTGIVHDEQI